ncbi:uncharacterized protein LOC100679222 [Nasonia vitripennis]|uniref:Regulatory protein zeste n=1 Tax=Nasonia vitripennis TaxID=7425 RepID=A0A7M7Q8P9_NASVI|nr:uncharacterized protein LOC100679222 [Nasonia vitripennis]
MLKFISDNPEIITHSSTKDNERALWKELVTKLNDLKPEKSIDNWKNFWQRWQASVSSKPESILTPLDCKLKVFIAKIMNNSETIEREDSRARYTIKEIEDTIRDIEKERSKQQLQIDENDYKIEIYKINIKRLENENTEKRKRIQQINDKKRHLHKQRRIITGRVENVYESSKFNTLKKEIKKEPLV